MQGFYPYPYPGGAMMPTAPMMHVMPGSKADVSISFLMQIITFAMQMF